MRRGLKERSERQRGEKLGEDFCIIYGKRTAIGRLNISTEYSRHTEMGLIL